MNDLKPFEPLQFGIFMILVLKVTIISKTDFVLFCFIKFSGFNVKTKRTRAKIFDTLLTCVSVDDFLKIEWRFFILIFLRS